MKIDYKKVYNAILAGASEVMKNRVHLNNINVFPVADGDTGSNLFSTMDTIIRTSKLKSDFKTTIDSVADAALVGARGNSGIIFAQFFNGFSQAFDSGELTIEKFIESNNAGYEFAYKAIAKPVEGTVITVMNTYVIALKEAASKTSDYIKMLELSYEEVEQAVKNTPNQLKLLKKESVVDSGAEGFMFFLKGFIQFLKGDKQEFERKESFDFDPTFDKSEHSLQEIKYRYCTEAMIVENKVNPDVIIEKLSKYGDSLIVAANERTGRVHIHTDTPDLVFEELASFSEVVYQKADDMQRQSDVVFNRLHDIAVVTDSIADLPTEFIDKYQIHVVNINILIERANYFDKLTINNRMVDELMDKSLAHPTTSQPDIKTVENLYNYLLSHYKSVIVLTVSSSLSGTFNVFNKVRENLKLEDKVTIIDTLQNSGAEGLLVELTARKVSQGLSHRQVVDEVTDLVRKSKIIVKVKTLKNMISSGRLSSKAGRIAKLVKLRPLITLDEMGNGTIETIAFTDSNAYKKLLKRVKRLHQKQKITEYNVVHIMNEIEGNRLANDLEKIIGFKANYITETSSVIAIGAGNGATAVSFITETE